MNHIDNSILVIDIEHFFKTITLHSQNRFDFEC